MQGNSVRMHNMDALRALAMILGVFLHAAIPYKIHPTEGWPKDPFLNNPVFDGIYYFIHSFRMELFFFIAGLFCTSMVKRKGISAFLKNRIDRIIIPLFFSLLLVAPASIIPFRLFTYYTTHQNLPFEIIGSITTGTFLKWNGLVHFWFLYYLIFYYGLFILFVKLKQVAYDKIKFPLLKSVFDARHRIPMALIAFLMVWIILLFSGSIPFRTSTSIVPPPVNFIYYFLFFSWGAAELNSGRGLMKGNPVAGYLFLAGWLVVSTVGFWIYYRQNQNQFFFPDRLWVAFIQAAASVFAVIGLVKLSALFFHKEIKLIRYISDSSYWMYIIHVVLVVLFQLLLVIHPRILPNILKYPAILLFTIGVSLSTYAIFVRYTFIGAYLHGRKHRSKQVSKK